MIQTCRGCSAVRGALGVHKNLPQGKPQPLQQVNVDLHQLYCWHKFVLICASWLGLGKQSGFCMHCSHQTLPLSGPMHPPHVIPIPLFPCPYLPSPHPFLSSVLGFPALTCLHRSASACRKAWSSCWHTTSLHCIKARYGTCLLLM